jgi:hypothetical protein
LVEAPEFCCADNRGQIAAKMNNTNKILEHFGCMDEMVPRFPPKVNSSRETTKNKLIVAALYERRKFERRFVSAESATVTDRRYKIYERHIEQWAGREINARKGARLPHEAGLKLLKTPSAPKDLPVTALIRNAHAIPDWEPFVRE